MDATWFAIGIGSGMALGIAIGSDESKKKDKRLKEMIHNGAIQITTETGEVLEAEEFIKMITSKRK